MSQNLDPAFHYPTTGLEFGIGDMVRIGKGETTWTVGPQERIGHYTLGTKNAKTGRRSTRYVAFAAAKGYMRLIMAAPVARPAQPSDEVLATRPVEMPRRATPQERVNAMVLRGGQHNSIGSSADALPVIGYQAFREVTEFPDYPCIDGRSVAGHPEFTRVLDQVSGACVSAYAEMETSYVNTLRGAFAY